MGRIRELTGGGTRASQAPEIYSKAENVCSVCASVEPIRGLDVQIEDDTRTATIIRKSKTGENGGEI
jgi:hypothetical protein